MKRNRIGLRLCLNPSLYPWSLWHSSRHWWRSSRVHWNGRQVELNFLVWPSLILELGTRVGRVKVIFTLPTKIEAPGTHILAPSSWPKGPLAYVEWYTCQVSTAHKVHGMYQISKATDTHGRWQGAIIPLTNIRQSCMLFPVFKGVPAEAKWHYDNVLDRADTFLINNWLSKYSYQTIW